MVDETIRIKIIHDGNGPAYMAKIVDANTGKLIQDVTEVSFKWNAKDRGLSYALLKVVRPIVEVTVDAKTEGG
jgi:hypothetical protein